MDALLPLSMPSGLFDGTSSLLREYIRSLICSGPILCYP
jgi:hypothetical protein